MAEYLKSLPEDRRRALETLRDIITKNLDSDYSEGMQYGMIGYYVPHSVYPAGYHCDPKQPLPFAGLASQKNHMSLYLMSSYGDEEAWLQREWQKTGKKLDMGKCCIRFKKLEDIPLEVIAEAFRRMPASKFIALYENSIKKSKQPSKTFSKKLVKGIKSKAKPSKLKKSPR
ncbi:MAG TPA: DUF1801 domain-containing protein [Gemmatales bacterium]|nr:DUF1801 domain-containing protein [Gemmatales bacterium]